VSGIVFAPIPLDSDGGVMQNLGMGNVAVLPEATTAPPARYSFITRDSCEMCGAGQRNTIGLRLDSSQGSRPERASGVAVTIAKCDACELIYANPMPVPESLDDHYAVPAEAYWLPEYFDEDPTLFAAEIATAKRLLGFREGMTALDIGERS
jgi:hypothetical protein